MRFFGDDAVRLAAEVEQRMRLAHLVTTAGAAPRDLAELVSRHELELLQVDFRRPAAALTDPAAEGSGDEFAPGLAPLLSALAEPLTLAPEFHLATSAGWSNAYVAAEAAAQTLAGYKLSDVPLSAVRGCNLLPILEDLLHGGVDLRDEATGQRWHGEPHELTAADLQVGAGPLQTAWSEGARVVVAGSYEATAPVAAAAVARFDWDWTDWTMLAGAAVASRAALWRDARRPICGVDAADESSLAVVELAADGGFFLTVPYDTDDGAADRLRAWLVGGSPRSVGTSADVALDLTKLRVVAAGRRRWQVQGAVGSRPSGRWRLEFRRRSGYCCSALIEFLDAAADSFRERVRCWLADFAAADGGPSDRLTVHSLPASNAPARIGWLHVQRTSSGQDGCRRLSDAVTDLAERRHDLLRLSAGRPAISELYDFTAATIGRDVVDIAVDTRAAKDWL